MPYPESFEKSNEYLRMVLKYLGQFQIPPNPFSYTVWYEYVSGRNPELTEAIDKLIANGTSFTPEIIRGLLKHLIANKAALSNEKAQSEIRDIIRQMQEYFTSEENDMQSHTDAIETHVNNMPGDISFNELQKISNDILSETKSIVDGSNRLKKRLKDSSKEVARLKKELESFKEKATRDVLTGIGNRAAFESDMMRETTIARKNGKPLSLLLCDIDHFKKVNDTYGHLIGDKVLKATASILKSQVKGRDCLSRYGGEEFAIILPDTALESGLTVAEKIRRHFNTLKWTNKGSKDIIKPITISIGAALYRPGESVDDTIKRADVALYNSKNTGRNRVTDENGVSLPAA